MERPVTRKRTRNASALSLPPESSYAAEASGSEASEPRAKRRRVTNRRKDGHRQWEDILRVPQASQHLTSMPAARHHTIGYHRPLLLDSQASREALLRWFNTVSASRLMPWRKSWIDPHTWDDPDELRAAMERRAYEVWISEIMLQQTRVSVVIDYWKKWLARWPTLQDLARAEPEDVLSAWRGLGYYSRATRIHEAAQIVAKDPILRGLLPEAVSDLKRKVPGIGPYTAGAISAIVFGRPEAMVDGNVIRVLSRQMGLFVNFKTSKAATDIIWAAADALVKAACLGSGSTSDRPGSWGQALMELGSTVCTPKPDCSRCPITSTCRVFGEGTLFARVGNRSSSPRASDLEDMCTLCEAMEDPLQSKNVESSQFWEPTKAKSKKLGSAVKPQPQQPSNNIDTTPPSLNEMSPPHTLELVVDYAARFPVKGIKKAPRVEQSLVCAIRCGDQYLIQKRPNKGLLAGLWELPSFEIPGAADNTPQARKRMAESSVQDLLKRSLDPHFDAQRGLQLKHYGELGDVQWLFSHIKLTMHVHLFTLEQEHIEAWISNRLCRWVTSGKVEEESMGTGMRKCWALVKARAL